MSYSFKVSFATVFSAGQWVNTSGNSWKLGPGPGPGPDINSSLIATPSGQNWYVPSHGGLIPYHSLPSGFTVVPGSVRWSAGASAAGANGGTTVEWTWQDSYGNVTPVRTVYDTTAVFTGLSLSAFQIHSGAWTINGTVPSNTGDYIETGFSVAPGVHGVSGLYDLLNFTYTIDPITGSTINPEETITITSDLLDPDHLELDHVTISIDGQVVVPTTQTETLLVFTVPIGIVGTADVTADGDGTQFTGSLSLGSYVVLSATGSGIYTIVVGKSNDTIYDNDNPGETIDNPIPDPFAKTGFIGS